MSPIHREILGHFEHIELTDEELAEAIIAAKRKKEAFLESSELRRREEENRRHLTGKFWSYDQIDSFMRYRANQLFNGKFKFDGQCQKIYELMCAYFTMDERFFELSKELNVPNPAFGKGIYLGGNFGVGKTWIMNLFCRNQRQVYQVRNAKEIATAYQLSGDESLPEFLECPILPINDSQNFFHPIAGLCIDDMGTEDIVIYFGNRKNVVGDVIELRYAKQIVGPLMHVTTNLTGEQMKDFYGPRVASRLRECMNIIDFKGEDLRK